MIRKIIVLALTLMLSSSLFGVSPKKKSDFRERLSAATLAVYSGKQVCEYKTIDAGFFGPIDVWTCEFKSKFTCTATVIDRHGDTYVGLTAGHCFVYALLDSGVSYYVSDEVTENPVLRKISILKFDSSSRYDYAIFEFHSNYEYPTVQMLEPKEQVPEVGTDTISSNFSLGVVKQVAEGKIVSKQIGKNEGGAHCDGHCAGRFFVDIGVGPGASGSAIVDVKTEKIIGMVEGVFGNRVATLIVPLGRPFYDFMEDSSAGLRPISAPGAESGMHKIPSPRQLTSKELFYQLWQRWKEFVTGTLPKEQHGN